MKLDEARLREPLRAKLGGRSLVEPPRGYGKASAVLIPLFEREGEAHAWLVRRTRRMRAHSGQVAFPGGKCDPSDASPLATALREAEEEIGLAPDTVDVLGRLEDLSTITGYVIAPFVAWLPGDRASDWSPAPNPDEVARVFAAPLRTFLETPRGMPPMRGYPVDGEFVWGATAAIARELMKLVAEVAR